MLTNVDNLVAILLTSFQKTEVLYLHCKAGVGRSAHLGLMATLLLEAKTKNLSEIQADYEKDPVKHKWELKKLKQRHNFFTHFHHYCAQANPAQETFTSWMATHNLTPTHLQSLSLKKIGPNGTKIKSPLPHP